MAQELAYIDRTFLLAGAEIGGASSMMISNPGVFADNSMVEA